MQKTTIIFDCFGVICSKPIESWFRKHLGDWEISKKYFSDIARRFDLNIISEQDTWKELAEKVGSSPEKVLQEIDAYFSVDLDLVRYMKELKDKGYKIGLISNGHHESFERRVFPAHDGLRELFDQIVISSNIGMVKPDPEIYNHALDVLGSKAQEVIFIDDNQSNVVGAEAVGIRGILYVSLEKLKTDLAVIGIS